MPVRAQGSLWGRWDLHFHTPTSFDYKDKSVTNQEIVDGLVAAKVDVVAITDHHTLDVARMQQLRSLADDRITVLPGIEFRTELGGKEKVHLIGIFPEDADLDDLWTKLSGQLGLTQADVNKKGGDESIYVDFREAANLIHSLGGVVTTHAGGKSNSIENIANNAEFKMALKTDLARECVDIYEIGKLSDRVAYEKIVFPAIKKTIPLILGSDNHNIKQYDLKATCWIKGDPTFRTFQQLITDPNRAFIGELPGETVRIDTSPTKYVQSIRFEKDAESKLDEIWFSGLVPLNPGLVAIIGNKGSGKTALAETIGLLGDCTSSHAFSFLNQDKFRQARNSKAKEFTATLTWRDDHAVSRSLSDMVDENAPPTVSYIPQSYLEEICNEVNNRPGSAFDKELKSVIFSHVSDDKRLGADSLDDLLKAQTEILEERIDVLRKELSGINRSILDLEQRGSEKSRQLLVNLKEGKDRELASHDAIKPAEKPKPEADAAQQAAMELINAGIAAANLDRDQANETLKTTEIRLREAALQSASSERLTQHLRNFEASFNSLLTSIEPDCDVLGLNPQTLVAISVNFGPLIDASEASKRLSREQTEAARDANLRLQNQRTEIERLTLELDAPNKAYQQYLEALRTWTEKRESIIGTADTPESLAFYENEIAALEEIPNQLKRLRADRQEKVKQIFTQIEEIVLGYRKLYHPVQEFILQNQIANQKFQLEFDASIIAVNLEETVLGRVDRGRKGTFNGLDDGKRRLKGILDVSDLQTSNGVIEFSETLMRSFYSDYRYDPPVPMTLSEQMRGGADPLPLVDAIYGLGYLSPKYQLKWSGKGIEELSPGERGTLLLIFYLLIDRRDVPLIIDQPEDNLDNQTVFDLLVACLREARKRRQVIIVTHNPNLAVACDADQVIHSQIDKQGKNAVTYTAGALENPITNALCMQVLEGTRPAFDHRKRKYHEGEEGA